jgi:hypothetical protein
MAFYVGQKVVCVDDYWDPQDRFPAIAYPKKGTVYTIRSVHKPCCSESNSNEPFCVMVDELKSPPGTVCLACGEPGEMDFRHSRFRPLIERKTSIEIFTKMLTPNKRQREVV